MQGGYGRCLSPPFSEPRKRAVAVLDSRAADRTKSVVTSPPGPCTLTVNVRARPTTASQLPPGCRAAPAWRGTDPNSCQPGYRSDLRFAPSGNWGMTEFISSSCSVADKAQPTKSLWAG